MILLTENLSLFGKNQRAVAAGLQSEDGVTMSLLMNYVDMSWAMAVVVSVQALSQ